MVGCVDQEKVAHQALSCGSLETLLPAPGASWDLLRPELWTLNSASAEVFHLVIWHCAISHLCCEPLFQVVRVFCLSHQVPPQLSSATGLLQGTCRPQGLLRGGTWEGIVGAGGQSRGHWVHGKPTGTYTELALCLSAHPGPYTKVHHH